ncbi:MAG: M48 family metallopeptidase, partial [Bdellovibrionota bacterium]
AGQKIKVDKWDVVVFKSDQVNAFALPGGHIGVYDGIFKAAKSDGQLATVLAHEIGHVIAHHGSERVSQQELVQGAEGLAGALLIGPGNPNSQILMGALGLAGTVGIELPFSRTQESEADLIGLDLMSRSGFDPHEAIALWNNMLAQSQGEPPVFLSDHPATKDRIVALNDHLPEANTKFNQAHAQGLAPHCESSGVIP